MQWYIGAAKLVLARVRTHVEAQFFLPFVLNRHTYFHSGPFLLPRLELVFTLALFFFMGRIEWILVARSNHCQHHSNFVSGLTLKQAQALYLRAPPGHDVDMLDRANMLVMTAC